MSKNNKRYSLNLGKSKKESSGGCGCGKTSGGCHSQAYKLMNDNAFLEAVVDASVGEKSNPNGFEQVFDVKMD